jgi:hypothetical protein
VAVELSVLCGFVFAANNGSLLFFIFRFPIPFAQAVSHRGYFIPPRPEKKLEGQLDARRAQCVAVLTWHDATAEREC